MEKGIYILANDVVFDQLIALINSIEVNASADLPICIIPYDDRTERVRKMIESEPRLTLFENRESIRRWEDFAHRVWGAHPRASEGRLSRPNWYKGHLQRKLAAFDGAFDRFVFYEADTLAMRPIDDVFEMLETHDLVFDDWEHRKPPEATALDLALIERVAGIPEAESRRKIHDASFWGGRKGLFPEEQLLQLQRALIDDREVEWINGRGWWDDVFLFNYLSLKADCSMYNFALSPDGQKRTGNCANVDPFVAIDNVLYNEQGLKPIHRIHFMNYAAIDFTRLCQGEEVDIRYRDVFLYYRFLKEPESRPKTLTPANATEKLSRKTRTIFKKIQRMIG